MNTSQMTASLITLLVLVQFSFFGALVAKARVQFDVAAPLTTGPEAFARLQRVHLNTLERLALFLPLLWMASLHAAPVWFAPPGLLFVIARFAYWRGYVREPSARKVGNVLSMVAIAALLVLNLGGLLGALR